MSDSTTTITSSFSGPQLFGHPRGLATLFLTETFERFTYYGMRAILVLFMTAAATGNNLAGRLSGEIDFSHAASMHGQFLYLFWWGIVAGLVMLALTPSVQHFMSGVK
jgi:dipeptide/tripeptide permease